MIITSLFTENGQPKEGLSPIINIWDVVKNTKILNDGACEEIGGGFYKFNFKEYSPLMQYSMIIDGGESQPFGERYNIIGNEHADTLEEIKNYIISSNKNSQYNNLLQEIGIMKEGMSKELKELNTNPEIIEVIKEVPVIQEKVINNEFDYDYLNEMLNTALTNRELKNKRENAKMLVKQKKRYLLNKLKNNES